MRKASPVATFIESKKKRVRARIAAAATCGKIAFQLNDGP